MHYSGMIVFLADDLTGACDVGAECLRNGRAVRCLFVSRPGWMRDCRGAGGGVRLLDLETRRMSLRSAVARARRVASALRRIGVVPAYFKIDSTLRGNLVGEAEALRRGTGRRLAWLVPANPAQGRKTVGGRQFVRGVPVERTAFSRDPLHPVRTGNVVEMVEAVLGRGSCVRLGLRDLGRGAEHVGRLRRRWVASGVRMVVADAVTDDDLRRITRCISREDIACGAASLARYLLRSRAAGPRRGVHPFIAGRLRSGRWLAVIGSLNPRTESQVRLASRRARVVRLTPRDLAGPGGRALRAGEIAARLAGGRWGILALDPGTFRSHFRRNRLSALRAGERIARALAGRAAEVMWRLRPDGLLLSGGLTAAAVCERLGISRLVLRSELLPGVVASEARVPRYAGRTAVITKPGGFGEAAALARLTGRQGGEE